MRTAMVQRSVGRAARGGVAGLIAALLLTSLALVPPAATVYAAGTTYIVTSTADNVNDANCTMASCTLRQAVNLSNMNNPGAGNANRIIFSVSGTITLLTGSGGALSPTVNVTVDATAGNQAVTVSGNNAVQLFSVTSGVTLGLTGLTLTNGNATNYGGAIINNGTVNITSSTLSGNGANNGGGAIINNGTANITGSTFATNSAPGSVGGAIYNANNGTLTVTNGTFFANSANSGGGAIYNGGGSTLAVTGSTFSGNRATYGSGGGVASIGALTLTLAVVAGNTAGSSTNGPDISGTVTTDGGGNVVGNTVGSSGLTAASDRLGTVANPLNPNLGPFVNNGGPVQTFALQTGSPAIDILACPMTLTTDARGVPRPQGPKCDAGSYELALSPQTLTVTNALDNVNDANCAAAANGGCTLRQAVNLSNATTGTMTNTITFAVDATITLLAASGGTLMPTHNMTIDATAPVHTVTIGGNNAVGLFNVHDTGVTLGLSGLSLVSGKANYGGAIINNGMVNITGSTFAGNNAAGSSGFGGGAIFNLGTVTVTNSTFAANSAATNNSSGGGAIFNTGGGTANITGSTFGYNSAPNSGGGAIANSGTLTLTLAVLAGNTAGSTGPDIQGRVTTDGGGNVVGNTGGSSGLTSSSDKLGAGAAPLNPLLGSLGAYGGTVQTLPLLPGSPAIDILACPMTLTADARGVSRPQPAGGKCDAGSYEARPFTLITLTGNTQQQAMNFPFTTPLGLTVSGTMGDPVAGGLVTFTIIPGSSGASAAFGTAAGCTNTGATVTACTIAAGGAVATPRLTANGVLGTFTVIASAAGAANAVFTLTIATPNAMPAPAPTGVVSATRPAPAPTTHTPGMAGGASMPTPLPQPVRH